MNLIRVTVDTNVTVSGLLFGGLPFKLIQAALKRRFIWVTSPYLIDEAEKVLSSHKFGLTKHEIQILTQPIFEIAELVVPNKFVDVIPRCPGDNRVIECAIEGHCSLIVSGDRRDLLALAEYRGIRILSPRRFFNYL